MAMAAIYGIPMQVPPRMSVERKSAPAPSASDLAALENQRLIVALLHFMALLAFEGGDSGGGGHRGGGGNTEGVEKAAAYREAEPLLNHDQSSNGNPDGAPPFGSVPSPSPFGGGRGDDGGRGGGGGRGRGRSGRGGDEGGSGGGSPSGRGRGARGERGGRNIQTLGQTLGQRLQAEAGLLVKETGNEKKNKDGDDGTDSDLEAAGDADADGEAGDGGGDSASGGAGGDNDGDGNGFAACLYGILLKLSLTTLAEAFATSQVMPLTMSAAQKAAAGGAPGGLLGAPAFGAGRPAPAFGDPFGAPPPGYRPGGPRGGGGGGGGGKGEGGSSSRESSARVVVACLELLGYVVSKAPSAWVRAMPPADVAMYLLLTETLLALDDAGAHVGAHRRALSLLEPLLVRAAKTEVVKRQGETKGEEAEGGEAKGEAEPVVEVSCDESSECLPAMLERFGVFEALEALADEPSGGPRGATMSMAVAMANGVAPQLIRQQSRDRGDSASGRARWLLNKVVKYRSR